MSVQFLMSTDEITFYKQTLSGDTSEFSKLHLNWD